MRKMNTMTMVKCPIPFAPHIPSPIPNTQYLIPNPPNSPMILYSVTVNIEEGVHDEWLHWMKTEHIPDVLNTGLFVDNKILKLLTEVGNGGVTYSFQYYLRSIEDYETYQNEHAPRLQAEHARRYHDKFVAFRTLLEVIA